MLSYLASLRGAHASLITKSFRVFNVVVEPQGGKYVAVKQGVCLDYVTIFVRCVFFLSRLDGCSRSEQR